MNIQDKQFQGLRKALFLRTEQIPKQGFSIEELLPVAFLSALLAEPGKDFEWQALKEGRFSCLVKPEGNAYHLQGRISTALFCPCVRCLQDVCVELNLPLNHQLLEGEIEPLALDTGADLESFADEHLSLDALQSDLVVSYYQDGVIDLEALLREELFLALPAFPACEDMTSVAEKRVCRFESISIGPGPGAVFEDPIKEKLRVLKANLL